MSDWSDSPAPEDMSDALANVGWALNEMLRAIDEGRYRYEPVHVRADLTYLRAEVRRAKRQRTVAITTYPPGDPGEFSVRCDDRHPHPHDHRCSQDEIGDWWQVCDPFEADA